MEEQKSGRTIRGTFLLMCSSVVIVLFSAISQIALGWLLSDNDFGVYAIAIGVVAVSQILRDGGVTVWLARCDQETFDKEKESAFGLTVLCSLVIAVGLILFSQPAVMIYKDERLSSLLIVLAMGIVTMGVGAVPFAKLQIQGKLNEIAMIGIASGFIRFLGPIPLALLGFGPMSIAIAVAVSGLIRLVLLMKTADYYPTTLKISIPKAGEFLKTTKWALLGSFVTTLFWQLDYLILGTSVSLAIVGSYYFAYQICSQVVNIATMALRTSIIPYLAKLNDSPDQQHRTMIMSARIVIFSSSVAFFSLSLWFPYIEDLVWRGRWKPAIEPLFYLANAMPFLVGVLCLDMLVQAKGEFVYYTKMMAVRCLGLAATVIALLFLFEVTPRLVAIFISIYTGCMATVSIAFILRRYKMSSSQVAKTVLLPYSAGLLMVTLITMGQEFLEFDMTISKILFPVIYLAIILLFSTSHRSDLQRLLNGFGLKFLRGKSAKTEQ